MLLRLRSDRGQGRQFRWYGGVPRSAFAAAGKEFVFYTDGDGQYDPGEFPRLLDLMEPGVRLVNGFKPDRNDPWDRIWVGKVYKRLRPIPFRIRDVDCDFRLIRRELLDRIQPTSTSGTIRVELVRKLELSPSRVVETGVHHYPRLHGRSQLFRIKSLLITLAQPMRLYVRLVLLA